MRLRYFLDFEFSEGFFKPISWLPAIGFNKKQWSIELISIGIKCEDGRRYYAINENYRRSRCNEWVKENVLPKLPERYTDMVPAGYPSSEVSTMTDYVYVKNELYKSISEIKADILNLVKGTNPIFYGYFSDYDWVLFCTIFGTMMDLPKGFQMYCIDLKQEFDNAVRTIAEKDLRGVRQVRCFSGRCGVKKETDDDFEIRLDNVSKQLKASANYPKQSAEDEHDACKDAEWNFELYKFLETI